MLRAGSSRSVKCPTKRLLQSLDVAHFVEGLPRAEVDDEASLHMGVALRHHHVRRNLRTLLQRAG